MRGLLVLMMVALLPACDQAPEPKPPVANRDRQTTSLKPEQLKFLKIEEVGGGGEEVLKKISAQMDQVLGLL